MDPLFFDIDEQEAEEVTRSQRRYRETLDLEHFTDEEIVGFFCLGRTSIEMLIGRIGHLLQSENKRRWVLSPVQKLLIALRYYATGDQYATIGLALGVKMCAVSTAVDKVTNALLRIAGEYIRMPIRAELQDIMEGFYQKAGLPRIIGAIDGTYFKIVRSPNELDGPYICRKIYASINAMALCDDKTRFRMLLAKFPGSCHDSYILRSSLFFGRLQDGTIKGIVMGNSGYPQLRWLFNSLRTPQTAAEERYNRRNKKTRSVIFSGTFKWIFIRQWDQSLSPFE